MISADRLLVAMLRAGEGTAFISDQQLYDLSPDIQLKVWREEYNAGYRILVSDPRAPVDLGAATTVETRALPSPEETKP